MNLPAYFHNNIAATIEDAVAFYTTPAFANSGAGGGVAIPLTLSDIDNIGRFLRVINAAFNNCSRAKGEANPNKEDLEKVTAKDKLVEAAKAVQAYCDAVFAAQTDASLAEMVTAGQNQVPRGQLLLGVISHNMNEYGQKVILMRLKGIVPPTTERATRKPGN